MTEPPVVGFVGLGLIGGSLALALREAAFAAELLAWDADAAVLERGLALGVIDRAAATLDELMAQADIAVLCTPSVASEALLLRMLEQPRRAFCITDVASVKGPLCAAAASLPADKARRFVPGHPIAGSERSGVSAARADLFARQRVILTPGESTDPQALARVRELWEAIDAEVHLMDVAEHDRVLAATSHLPHILAYALVEALAKSSRREQVFRFAAGGFRDFTRIASSDPVMWRDVALANREALLDALDDFQDHLTQMRGAIAAGDATALHDGFAVAKQVRDEFARDLEQRVRRDTVEAERRGPK